MRILKKGTVPGEIAYQGKCSTCTTEVECKRSECKVYSDQREAESYYSYVCPVCKTSIPMKSTGQEYKEDDPKKYPREKA